MAENGRLHDLAYEARRVGQTVRTFQNWPALLRDMAEARIGRGASELTFVTRGGLKVSAPNIPGARLPLYEQFADDCYQLGWFLGPLATTPFRAIDVGAHIGSFTTRLASLNPGVRIDSYEPSPATAEYLRRNVDQNGFGDRVTVHEAALAGEAGFAIFDDNSGGSVHNGLIKGDRRLVDGSDGAGARGTIKVATTTFDQAVGDDPVTLVKMDCEGGEYDLVYRSSPESWASVRRVVMEYHPVPGETWDKLRDWLAAVGLNVVRHEPNGTGLGTAWLSRPDDSEVSA